MVQSICDLVHQLGTPLRAGGFRRAVDLRGAERGLQAHAAQAAEQVDRKPYDINRELALGLGGDAGAPAREAKAALAHLIRRKHPR